jgi:beta-1,4-mannosyltransferase
MKILAWPGAEVSGGNPYTRLLYEPIRKLGHKVEDFTFRRAFAKRYDIFHFHWPEYYVANPNPIKAIVGTFALLLAVRWARARGTKILWTSHNLESHHKPRPRMEQWFWRAFTHSIDGFIAMTEYGREETRLTFPHLRNCPSFVIPHGSYRGEYANSVSKAEARSFLAIPRESKVICFLGTISQYKGVPQLVSAFMGMPAENARLVIAGTNENQQEASLLESLARRDGRITLRLGFVPAEQLQHYFNASDLVALPFRKIWNSGSAMLALSFDRPILVPAQGAFLELQEQTGSDWIRTYEGALTSGALKDALAWATNPARPVSASLDGFDWQSIAEETVHSYSELIQHRSEQTALRCVEERPHRTS